MAARVHLVTPELDDGPVLIQARVPVLPGDDAQKLAARVLVEEHRIYPEALARSPRAGSARSQPARLNCMPSATSRRHLKMRAGK